MTLPYAFIYFVNLCVYVCMRRAAAHVPGEMHMLPHRMICRSWCSFSVTWVPGIKLRLLSLVASALTHRVLLPALLLNFENTYLMILKIHI